MGRDPRFEGNNVNEAVSWSTPEPGVLLLSLQHPPANALGLPIVQGINAGLDFADGLGDVKVVVVTSSVEGFFAAGADIKHMGSIDAESFTAYGDALRGALDRLSSPDRLSIAAVSGLALGGGMELAMACHLRVCSPKARFGLPEVKLGLIPGAGGTQRLPRLVGRGRALDIMLTGRQLGAEEALSIGLVNRVADDVVSEGLVLARELITASAPAQAAIVRTVDAAFDMDLGEGMDFEVAQEQELFEHGEAAEGLRAFLDKRAPNFA